MGRLSSSTILAVGLALAALPSGLLAQGAPQLPPILAPKKEPTPAPDGPRRSRALSPEVAAQLAAAAPKYTPAPPKPEPKPESEMVDAREVDKPRNGIIRLPRYIVVEPKPRVFNERNITSDKGLKDIAMRRYISDIDRALNRYSIPLFAPISIGSGDSTTEARALAMYAEDERLRNMTDMSDAANTVSKSDAAQGTYILRESQRTYMRTSDFGWQNDNKK